MGTTGVCGGEGAERAAGGGVLDLPSPSGMGPELLRTELSRSANFTAADFRKGGTGTLHFRGKLTITLRAFRTSKLQFGQHQNKQAMHAGEKKIFINLRKTSWTRMYHWNSSRQTNIHA